MSCPREGEPKIIELSKKDHLQLLRVVVTKKFRSQLPSENLGYATVGIKVRTRVTVRVTVTVRVRVKVRVTGVRVKLGLGLETGLRLAESIV